MSEYPVELYTERIRAAIATIREQLKTLESDADALDRRFTQNPARYKK